ncbi:MAG: LacI family DNA-binding transcriptional regulator [Planctomycetota bacterium]
MSPTKQDPPSLKAIAKACRLSSSTVSRALNMSEEDCPLKPGTRARVRRVAKKMGYQVNAHARALSSGRSNTAGLVFSGALPYFDGVYQSLIAAFTDTLAQHDYQLALMPLAPGTDLQRSLSGWMVDGCVSLQSLDPRAADVLEDAGLPCILLNGRSAKASGSVSPDDRDGARQATEYLLEQGHRRIAMVADLQLEDPHYSLYERRMGFESTMQAAGLADQAVWISATYEEAADKLLAVTPEVTAVMCYSQHEAAPLLGRLQNAGRRVPEDISLLTFNDVFPIGELWPAVTAVSVPSLEMGARGAEMLLKQIRHGRPDTSEAMVVGETLVKRQSTGPAPKPV